MQRRFDEEKYVKKVKLEGQNMQRSVKEQKENARKREGGER